MKRVLVVVGFLGAALLAVGVADARFDPGLNRVAADKGEVFRKGCLVGHDRLRSGPCRFGDLRSKKKIVLFGDSHAAQWGPGLIRLAEKKEWQLIVLTRASCPAALVNIDYYCDNWRRNSLERIRKIRPGIVVVASAANSEAYGVQVGGAKLSRESSEPYLVDGMVQTLKTLSRWSRKTMLIRDQAVTPFGTTRCLRYNTSRPGRCGFRPSRPVGYSYDYKGVRRVRGARAIDPQPMLCPKGWCRAVDGDILVYRNHGHLSATFTRSKHHWLARKLGDPWRSP